MRARGSLRGALNVALPRFLRVEPLELAPDVQLLPEDLLGLAVLRIGVGSYRNHQTVVLVLPRQQLLLQFQAGAPQIRHFEAFVVLLVSCADHHLLLVSVHLHDICVEWVGQVANAPLKTREFVLA